MLLRFLGHKFGVISDVATARIEALSGAQLLALYDAALGFVDAAELDRWLESNASAG